MSKKIKQDIAKVKKVASAVNPKGKRIVLTILLPGQLAGPVPQRKNWERRTRPCHLRRTISTEAVNYMISDESAVYPFNMKSWKKLTPLQKLDAHFRGEANGYDYNFAIID